MRKLNKSATFSIVTDALRAAFVSYRQKLTRQLKSTTEIAKGDITSRQNDRTDLSHTPTPLIYF